MQGNSHHGVKQNLTKFLVLRYIKHLQKAFPSLYLISFAVFYNLQQCHPEVFFNSKYKGILTSCGLSKYNYCKNIVKTPKYDTELSKSFRFFYPNSFILYIVFLKINLVSLQCFFHFKLINLWTSSLVAKNNEILNRHTKS